MRRFRLLWVLVGAAFLYLAETTCSFAQSPAPKAQTGQNDPLRVAPNAPPTTPEVRQESGDARGPANICDELVAFVQKAAAEGPAQKPAASAGAAPSGAPPAGSSNNKPSADASQQRSGFTAPVPQDNTASTASKLSSEQAQALASAHDLAGCQHAAQQMRRAGVALPPGLLALAALREDLLTEMPRHAPK
jgi:hypothetical protein